MSVLNTTEMKSHLDRLPFLDGDVGIQRYDVVAQPSIEKWNDKGLGNFWRPEEVDVTKDKADYESLSESGKHIFISNLKRQIALDTTQGRAPALAFLPIASTPEMEAATLEWSFQELIHSRSYTHILRNVLNDPSEVFDHILEITEIADLAVDISKYYDELIGINNHNASPFVKDEDKFSTYEHKTAIWKALFAANALEGIRFYVSFACSWSFAQVSSKMEGNAKIIKLICRDENEHLKFTQMLLTSVLKTDPDFVKIREETYDEMHELYMNVVKQEKEWAKYLFQYGDELGLDEKGCCDYIDWLANKRMAVVGMTYPNEVPKVHPMPWIETWISGNSRQNALQETENDSYIVGVLTGGLDMKPLIAKVLSFNPFSKV